jgi:hypothetical protein
MLRVPEMGHPAMRSHIPDFTKHLSPLGPRAFDSHFQIIHLEYEDRIVRLLGHGFSWACDTKGSFLSYELDPLATVSEADRQSESLVELG